MSDNCSKIISGPKLARAIPKVSVGKFLFDSLKQGNNDVAVIDAHTEKTLRYDQILEHSVRLARYYKKNNVGKGDVIAIVSENDVNYILPVLGALYVGATLHFANAHLTLGELSAMFLISKPKWIFCSENALVTANQLKNQFQCIQNIVTFGARNENTTSLEELLVENDPDLLHFEPVELNPEEDVAYIFSSSGTSGLPKCVMLTHYNAVAAIEIRYKSCKEIGIFQRGESTLVAAPFSHIMGFSYLMGCVATLGICILMKKFTLDLYLKSIEFYKVKRISCPPLLLKFLAESPLVDLYDNSSLIDITCGSAPIDPCINTVVRDRLNVTPRQIYGATETFGSTLITPLVLKKIESCGTPAPEIMVKVRDLKTHALLGCNQPGEICIKGPVLMKGYLDNPEETQNSFDDDGFYYTGDIGYYDSDSYFYIVDRLKDLIKYKGYQVSPSELEFLLSNHPAVKEVAVIGIPDEKAGEVPLAYVILNEMCHGNTSEQEIVTFVAERISITKRLYGGVKFVKEIPKNKNGKPLKRVLRNMYDKSLNERHN